MNKVTAPKWKYFLYKCVWKSHLCPKWWYQWQNGSLNVIDAVVEQQFRNLSEQREQQSKTMWLSVMQRPKSAIWISKHKLTMDSNKIRPENRFKHLDSPTKSVQLNLMVTARTPSGAFADSPSYTVYIELSAYVWKWYNTTMLPIKMGRKKKDLWLVEAENRRWY